MLQKQIFSAGGKIHTIARNWDNHYISKAIVQLTNRNHQVTEIAKNQAPKLLNESNKVNWQSNESKN